MNWGNRDTTGRRILILGGTTEARELAGLLVKAGYAVTTSLAGRTDTPRFPEGVVRMGGFGGREGLAEYLKSNRIEMVVDATHPFAAQISANAVAAAADAKVRLIRLERPAWKKPEGAIWLEVGSTLDAVHALPRGARVLLTVGRQDLGQFLAQTNVEFVARMIEVPAGLPTDWTVIAARGPFTLEGETELMEEHGITHLVTKNSGGAQVAAKLAAATQLSIPIIVIRRPRLPRAETVDSVAWAQEAIARIFRTG
ncbi:cobalt-precorrin-6A reductase [Pelagibacterium halotolerans]|uniref:Cobalt-precorrin-6x reductase n=1 Tax=Pelagibacterium halotolerans (strain DSM 22347 / JCM 15775 / CGMCC 1.7692 / B2) TaxID=1082931 RepID=G4REJ0_PELHB|nr:cobalt-precorrin-6A reductase [Pelagibacterium halotolerans]AEQ53922.1 cobalt-precorrin-6x reductase [Pelagibacterium halotolerans B2]QJR19937.1 cobalt-precorrin-6A reductase [Pelagibacterium halotolerans]SEA46648.1 precorrin-6A reductase [Pelagibacterium halotolerans]